MPDFRDVDYIPVVGDFPKTFNKTGLSMRTAYKTEPWQ
jgi:hypothetical protein